MGIRPNLRLRELPFGEWPDFTSQNATEIFYDFRRSVAAYDAGTIRCHHTLHPKASGQ